MATLPTASNESENGVEPRITVGLDIGTSKVCALIASYDEDSDNLNILGIGITDSEGLNRGVVVNIDKTVKTIKKVIEQAEQQAGITIEEVVVGIAGDHIEAFQSRGIIGISNNNREIIQEDVDRIIKESRNIKLPPERSILHVIPQEFIIDGQDGITAPIGMSGVRMEANVHVVTGLSTAIQNLYKCVERNGIKVKDIVLEPLACSHAVLNEEEKEVGVGLIDIGGGTTDIAIFEANVIRFTSVFGVAGKQVTDDIRKGLGIIASQAERIKREYGHGFVNSIMNDEVFMIPGIGGRKPIEINKSFLCKIIQPRLEEIFEFALAEIRRSGYGGSLGAGVVITGGATLIPGVDEVAAEILGMPVKIGYPSGISYQGLAPEVESPMYSTCVGLALYGVKKAKEAGIDVEDQSDESSRSKEKSKSGKKEKKGWGETIKNFLNDI
ncbi:MAG: cell division protein FtsA [Candidatus Kapabacteria bacterium]|jgi:cell division protein FtsA|nr:cell division protein FtsA [Candidatus Kapabacteria bacterium]